jgi:hypothetical protein
VLKQELHEPPAAAEVSWASYVSILRRTPWVTMRMRDATRQVGTWHNIGKRSPELSPQALSWRHVGVATHSRCAAQAHAAFQYKHSALTNTQHSALSTLHSVNQHSALSPGAAIPSQCARVKLVLMLVLPVLLFHALRWPVLSRPPTIKIKK